MIDLDALLTAHMPSLTREAEDEMDKIIEASPEYDFDDVAIRYCTCGKRIDGFYEYTDHLRAVAHGYRGN